MFIEVSHHDSQKIVKRKCFKALQLHNLVTLANTRGKYMIWNVYFKFKSNHRLGCHVMQQIYPSAISYEYVYFVPSKIRCPTILSACERRHSSWTWGTSAFAVEWRKLVNPTEAEGRKLDQETCLDYFPHPEPISRKQYFPVNHESFVTNTDFKKET